MPHRPSFVDLRVHLLISSSVGLLGRLNRSTSTLNCSDILHLHSNLLRQYLNFAYKVGRPENWTVRKEGSGRPSCYAVYRRNHIVSQFFRLRYCYHVLTSMLSITKLFIYLNGHNLLFATSWKHALPSF